MQIQQLAELANATIATVEARYARRGPALATGIAELDTVLDPITDGVLGLIASGRAGGRTTLALQLALAGPPALYLSATLSAKQIAERALAMTADVSSEDLRTGRLTEQSWWRLGRALGRIEDLPEVSIVDGVVDTQQVAAALKQRDTDPREVPLVVVDGLELGCNLGAPSRPDALRSLAELAGKVGGAWIVTVGLSLDDYGLGNGDAFGAFLDIVPGAVNRVLWFDNARSHATRQVQVYDRNAQGQTLEFTMRRGVPRFYSAAPSSLREQADTAEDAR